ncbi:MAG: hypothetical protein FWC34_08935 [Bacteroidetes bacterium]|nr:hypothetical protein [Bacteroidota bacterium]MCL2303460.1 hypothetical protein [Lentimicrobiaceae bacterium]
MKHFFNENKKNPWFWAFFIVIVVTLFAMPIMSKDAGNSGDEDGFQIPHARNVVNYFKTSGEDTTCMSFENLKYYGSSPDVLMQYWNDFFDVENISQSRHIFNALYGWIALLFAGLIAWLIGGWRASAITVLLLFFSPRFLGHSFNNPKDIPFAAGVMAATYFMILFFRQFPKVKISTLIFLILFIAFSISVRVGGVLLYAYFGLFGLVYLIVDYMKHRKDKARLAPTFKSKFLRMFLYGLGVVIVSYFLGILLWPYARLAPIKHTLEAFSEMSAFAIGIRQLFEGSLQWSDMLPWYYTPKFIFMTIPIAVIIGLLCFFVLLWKDKKNYFNYFIIAFAFLFPIFWIAYSGANVYGGWRHSLFAYPPMVVAAGLGFNLFIEWISKKTTKSAIINIAVVVVILLLLWHPIRHTVKNHPYQYIYFNELAGGINKAYGNHEMDYYYHSTREASEWVIANAIKSGLETGNKIKVATWHPASVQYFFRNDTADFHVSFSRWYERGNSDWDYAIFTITGIMSEEIKNANFPPKNAIYQIKVDGKPIGLVLKRETKDDFAGFQLKNKKEFESAIYHLKKVAETDPTNVSAFINLIESYFNTGKVDSAKIYIDQLLEYVPKYEPVNYMLAHYYNATREFDKALKVLKTTRENNVNFKAAYHFAFQLYAQQNDLKNAEKMMLDLLKINQLDEQGFNQLITIYKAQGLDERAAYKKAYRKHIEVFEKLGKKKEAQIYRDALKKL